MTRDNRAYQRAYYRRRHPFPQWLNRVRKDIEYIILYRMDQFDRCVVPLLRELGWSDVQIYRWEEEGR